MSRHCEIAGAGFAGLVAAIALRQRGWTVQVHERASHLRALGAGIFIWENGLRVLAAIDCYHAVLAAAHQAPRYVVRGARNEVIGAQVFGPAMGSRMLTLTRQDLFQPLLDRAVHLGVSFKVDSQIARADRKGALMDDAGTLYDADLVIGADGVNSNCADTVGIERERVRAGYGAIRLLIDRKPDDLGGVDDDDVVAFHSDGLRRLLYVPCSKDVLYLCLTMPADDEGRHLPVDRAAWTKSFPHLKHLLDRVEDQGRWDLFETVRASRWTLGSVALIGDAVHGMTPALGQGAGCAMMNALSLADTVARADDIQAALEAWERRERPLTQYTQDLAERLTSRGSASLSGEEILPAGTKWDAATMRTARHFPTGVSSQHAAAVAS